MGDWERKPQSSGQPDTKQRKGKARNNYEAKYALRLSEITEKYAHLTNKNT